MRDFCARPAEQPLLKPVLKAVAAVELREAPVTDDLAQQGVRRCLEVSGQSITGVAGASVSLYLRGQHLVGAAWREEGGSNQPLSLAEGPEGGTQVVLPSQGKLDLHQFKERVTLERRSVDEHGETSLQLGFLLAGETARPVQAKVTRSDGAFPSMKFHCQMALEGLNSGLPPEVVLTHSIETPSSQGSPRVFDKHSEEPPFDSRWANLFRYTAARSTQEMWDR